MANSILLQSRIVSSSSMIVGLEEIRLQYVLLGRRLPGPDVTEPAVLWQDVANVVKAQSFAKSVVQCACSPDELYSISLWPLGNVLV